MWNVKAVIDIDISFNLTTVMKFSEKNMSSEFDITKCKKYPDEDNLAVDNVFQNKLSSLSCKRVVTLNIYSVYLCQPTSHYNR